MQRCWQTHGQTTCPSLNIALSASACRTTPTFHLKGGHFVRSSRPCQRQKILYQPCWAMLSPSQLYNCHSRSLGLAAWLIHLATWPSGGHSSGSTWPFEDWLSGYIHGDPPLRVISYHISVFIDCICIIGSYVHMVVAWKTNYSIISNIWQE